jgi:two-component system sensor histidine kinase ChiS
MSLTGKFYIIFFYVLVYFLLVSNLPILAQEQNSQSRNFPEPVFEHFSLEHGFSQSSVFSILQDSRGFLWFGTVDGLNRYDGYSFKVFRNNPDDSTSISNNSVISLYEDNAGVMWVGTQGGGLNRYDKETGIFTRFIHNPNDPRSLSHITAFGILEDKSGVLWIGTNGGGLNKLVPGKSVDSTPTFIRYIHNPQDKTSLSSDTIGPIYEDKSGTIWIGTEGGLDKLIPGNSEGSSPSFVHFKHSPNDPTSLSGNQIMSIFEDHTGVLWIGTVLDGLNKLVLLEGEKRFPAFIRYLHNPKNSTSISSNNILSIFEDDSRNLWIGTAGGGLNKFDRATEEFTHSKFDPDDSRSLAGNWVYDMCQDNSGVLWFGTIPGGPNKFDPMKPQFNQYKHDAGDPKSLSGNRIFSMYEDRSGNLWIGTLLE